MKAKDLAEQLLKNPEFEVTVSVDISKGEDDYDHRAFGEEILEVMVEKSCKQITILTVGETNF